MFFVWNDQNESHIGKHGVEAHDAEYVIRNAKRPYPRSLSSVKWVVKGCTLGGRLIQVIFVLRSENDIDVRLLTFADRLALQESEAAVYVIHARPLRKGEK